jgi:ABC-type nitrate/sulfonate/bicarbonate transport system ATPase subunit/ABC-type transporter Mla maintaining outer membrane lipid asymmetry permease subunit MlaE
MIFWDDFDFHWKSLKRTHRSVDDPVPVHRIVLGFIPGTTIMSYNIGGSTAADVTDDNGASILGFEARNVDPTKCPFTNDVVSFELRRSSCVHLAGMSGAGKSTLSSYIAGLLPSTHRGGGAALRRNLGIEITKCEWNASIPAVERVGMLFQQTTLLDSLTVAGNVLVALENCPSGSRDDDMGGSGDDIDGKGRGGGGGGGGRRRRRRAAAAAMARRRLTIVKGLLESVGLDYLRDGPKRPSQLSGGMARRASLALQLAQHKHVIILDEPFAGLDHATGVGVARELHRIRRERGTALLLISHEPEIVNIVMGEATRGEMDAEKTAKEDECANQRDEHADDVVPSNGSSSFRRTVTLHRRESDESKGERNVRHPSVYGKDAHQRFVIKVLDYFLYSLPLILLTFLAAGLAISMLSADILRRVDVSDTVLTVVQREIKPIMQMFTGEEDVNPIYTMMINHKVRAMLNVTIPPAKASLYAMGMAKLFVLEIGPLITALLLSGRIGGSYSGEVATMQATAQNKLLLTLGISPVMWTFAPSLLASWLASPLLTLAGTLLALEIAAHVGPMYDIGNIASYRQEVWDAVFLPLRLRGVVAWKERLAMDRIVTNSEYSLLDPRSSFSESYTDALIEIATHPVCFHLIKSVVFMTIIMVVAEVASRWNADLTAKDVPKVITTSVVGGSLLVIFADWGFSQLLLKRH